MLDLAGAHWGESDMADQRGRLLQKDNLQFPDFWPRFSAQTLGDLVRNTV